MLLQSYTLLWGLFLCLFVSSITTTPLDDYVWRDDGVYAWEELTDYTITGIKNKEWTGYILNMTSCKWLNDSDFSSDSQSGSIWWHYLVVIVPDEVKSTTNATLWIDGGSMTDSPPTIKSYVVEIAAALAVTTKTVTGALFMIPNERTVFASDPDQKSRSEDSIIAYTWNHFLDDPTQPEWLVRFPMVKASVKAMDTVTAFMKQKFPEKNYQLDYYAVSGASKRGWTTWLVGAVDPSRVMLLIPVVLDAVNFVNVEHHQYRSYGGWAYALQDYLDENIMARLDDENMLLLSEYEDPYYYFDRLTMPKLIVNAGMDEFQQPDDTHYWWNDLPAPKHFIMTPNADHSEITGLLEVIPAMSTWLNHHFDEKTVPSFTWTINNSTGEIVATLDHYGLVYEANVWYAYSCGMNFNDGIARRDFRLSSLDNPCTCGIYSDGTCMNLKSLWYKLPLSQNESDGHTRTYSALLSPPEDGRWIAYFIDIKYRRDINDIPSKEGMERESKALKSWTSNMITLKKNEKTLQEVQGSLDIELPKDLAFRLEFTTAVSVWPDIFPYAACEGEGCKGYAL